MSLARVQSSAVWFTNLLRKIIRAPDFTALGLADPDAWRFHIGVESSGRVSFALPSAAGGQPKLTATLLEKLNELRFEPLTGGGSVIEWSNVTLHWTTPPP